MLTIVIVGGANAKAVIQMMYEEDIKLVDEWFEDTKTGKAITEKIIERINK